MPPSPAPNNAKDALKILGAGGVGFLISLGLLLLALRRDLARNPQASGEDHVYGLLLPSLEGALLVALMMLLFIIRRRIRARMLRSSSIE